jgi:hypothetical protein
MQDGVNTFVNTAGLDKSVEVAFQLRKLYHKYGEIVGSYIWPIEDL